jgi:predicted PurR-regulated permease PerM
MIAGGGRTEANGAGAVAGGSSGSGAAAAVLPRGQGLGRGVVVLAAAGALLVLLRLGAPVVAPLLLATFFAILCRPLYVRLLGRGVAGPLALLLVTLLLLAVVALLGGIVVFSAGQLVANLDTYREELAAQLAGLEESLAGLGIDPQAAAGAAGAGATSLTEFLLFLAGAITEVALNLFYLLLTILFLLADGPRLLALAEFGPGRALLVVVLITVINLSLENIVMPRVMGRGLSLSPLIVFVSFFFWTWLIGPPGALLSMFLTLLTVVILDSSEETRWIAEAMTGAPAQAAPGAPSGTATEHG